MNRTILLASLTILAWFASVLAVGAQGLKVEHLDAGYSITMPATLSISEPNRMPDFSLYRVSDAAGQPVLAIYLGNFPEKYPSPQSSISSTASIGGCKATLDRWSGKDGRLSGTTLVELTDSSDWPKFAHMLFINLPNTEAGIAEAIVRSFHREKPARAGTEH